MTLILRTATVTDPGLIRTNNEDAAYASSRLIAVADGIGGQPAGEVASDIAVRVLSALDRAPDEGDPVAALCAAVSTVSREIRAVTEADPASDGMGTTLTAALLCDDRLAVVHVGDSRGYLLRDEVLYRLTRDDTFVQALVDKGLLSVDQARSHPQRSLVTKAVQGADVTPSTGTVVGQPGDRLLLCSDGLSDVVTDLVIAQTLGTYADRRQCAEQLVKLAHQAGAPDNVTVVVADLGPETCQPAVPRLSGSASDELN